MWLFAKDGFVSIVKKGGEGVFMARGRNKKHLENLFPGLKIVTTPDADYRFRVILNQEQFTAFMVEQSESVNYDNFKNAVKDHDYHDCLSDIWSTMYRYQAKR
jgi:hypothetical protein